MDTVHSDRSTEATTDQMQISHRCAARESLRVLALEIGVFHARCAGYSLELDHRDREHDSTKFRSHTCPRLSGREGAFVFDSYRGSSQLQP